jgi:hypothetical protein
VRAADGGGYALSPIDRWTLGYATLLTGALLWGGPSPLLGHLLAAHALLAAVALLAPRARAAGRLGAFVGEFYGLLLVFALYTEVGLLNAAAGASCDTTVQRWAQAQPWPWLSAILHAAYLSYYPMVVGVPLAFWVAGRRSAARRTLLLVMVTFYLCYTLFLFFPVAGPRYLFPLAPVLADGGAIAAFTHELVRAGSAWGTAFPSSHVAVAVVTSACAGRESRALGRALSLATALLLLGTVYGQFHYAVDAVAGAAVGGLVLLGSSRRAGRAPEKAA